MKIGELKSFMKNRTKSDSFRKHFIILISVFLFASVSLFLMLFTVKDSLDKNNRIITETVIKSLNSMFMDIDDTYKTLEELCDNKSVFNTEDIKSAESVSQNIKKVLNENKFIDEIAFMSRRYDEIIYSGGIEKKSEFFGKRYNSEIYNEMFFENISTDFLNVKIIPSTTYKNLVKYPAEDPKSLFAFVKAHENSDIKILIFASEEKFIKESNLDTVGNSLNLKIYDYNDSVVFSNNQSNYYIDTTKISKDLKNATVRIGLKKYYISKSSYNYFYYVAETPDELAKSILLSCLILIVGFLLALYHLIFVVNKESKDIISLYNKVDIDENSSSLTELSDKIDEYKMQMQENDEKINTMSAEIKNSVFIKLINSGSFYLRNKKTADLVFKDILNKKKFGILSMETIKMNSKLPGYEYDTFCKFFNKRAIPFVHIEEKHNKNMYVTGLSEDIDIDKLISEIDETANKIRENDIEILVCISDTFKDLNNIYDAYKEVKICRDYRGIADKTSLMSTKAISFSLPYLPVNFKEELLSRTISKDESAIKDYIKDIFAVNMKNNLPICKFEFMLRHMLNAVIEIINMNKKENFDIYFLEQMFLTVIENFRDTFDVYGVTNSFINIIHMGINMEDNKKSTLNRGDIIKYINTHYNEDLYLAKIAGEFKTSAKYFSNYFKKELKIGFNEYLTQIRISHAKELLVKTDLSLAEISAKVGYVNQATFAVAFKKNLQVPPGKYREINKK